MVHETELEESYATSFFDEIWYAKEYPDVSRSRLDPAEHYKRFGRPLGRRACAKGDEHGLNVRHLVAKEIQFSSSDDVALLVTHAPAGRLKPHVLPYMKRLKESGFLVQLIVVVDSPLEVLAEESSTADGIIVRDNGGYDFGAWAHGLRILPALFDVNLLILTNDSVIPSDDSTVFRDMTDRLRSSEADIVGLTANHEFGWHIQSYFLGIKRSALTSQAFHDFIYGIRRIDDKFDVVKAYEIPFAAKMKEFGLRVEALFHGPHSNNPTISGWRELILQGFPFIKLMALQKNVFSIIKDKTEILSEMHAEWPAVCQSAGFDIDLIRNTIKSSEMGGIAKGHNDSLIVDIEQFRQ